MSQKSSAPAAKPPAEKVVRDIRHLAVMAEKRIIAERTVFQREAIQHLAAAPIAASRSLTVG